MIRCRRCGFELYENEIQCPNCGLPVRRERPQSETNQTRTGQRPTNPHREYDPERRNEYKKRRKKKKPVHKRWWFWVLVALFTLSIIGSIGGDDETSGSNVVETTKTTTAKETEEAISNAEPEYLEVSAEELYNAYENNEVKANSIYGGKMLCVSGYIEDIGIDIMDDPYISINDGESHSFWHVNAYFTKKNYAEEISQLEKGQEIKVIGKCDGKSIVYVQLSECEIVE